MNIEKWIIAHFSPTGGTKKVADAIAAGFHTPIAEMDLTKADSDVTLGENDALMVVLPVFAGGGAAQRGCGHPACDCRRKSSAWH